MPQVLPLDNKGLDEMGDCGVITARWLAARDRETARHIVYGVRSRGVPTGMGLDRH